MTAKQPTDVVEKIDRVLGGFVEAARGVFGADLKSIVLYGSAAEGQVRRTSDVNLMFVLTKFDANKAMQIRDSFRAAQAAIGLKVMFLLESEVQPAVEAFAVKFSDVIRRRRVLYGDDPFIGVRPSRSAEINRLKQTLLNLTLRLREAYVARGSREEQLAMVIADAAGPARACAATLLELQGEATSSPKEALNRVAAAISSSGTEVSWSELSSRMSEARETGRLEPGVAGPTLLALIDLLVSLKARVDELS